MDPFTSFPYDDDVLYWNGSQPVGLSSNTAHISWVMKMFSMAISSITLLLGTTGNGLVIFLTGFRMKKTVTTIWYLNLAVADFIFAICLSSDITYEALNHWTLGRLMCKLDTVVPFLNMFASVFFLTAISADRCISVVHPVLALNHRTLWRASLMAVFIWTMALVLSSPYFSFRDTERSFDDVILCTYNFGSDDASQLTTHRSMVATEFVLGFLIPFSVILACYCAIVVKLKGKIFGRFGRSFKIIVAVVVAFFCCWFPFHLFSILEMLDDSLEMKDILDIGFPLAKSLICLNSCLNPLLYAFMGPDCRMTNWQSLLSAFKGAFSENWATASFSSHRNSSSTSGMESSMV
ncbi:chemerin-like receptor 1 [Elgaria multicarinata webbii]|uniref:chemerin-like receptor 1 n=1 Tax=Elgaria multicarinata webbii TaxID=159646 RepID=UPI002FCCE68D